TEHADAILRRILFLEGDPDMRPDPIEPGKTLREMLRKDLDLEYKVRDNLAKGIALAEKHSDYITREILVKQQADTEEDHMYWLEKQLRLIEMIGEENYTQSRMGKDPEHGCSRHVGPGLLRAIGFAGGPAVPDPFAGHAVNTSM